jgi:S1-C subfamily serine protease
MILSALQGRSRRTWVIAAAGALVLVGLVAVFFLILHNQNRETAGQIAESGEKIKRNEEELRKAREEARQKDEELKKIRETARKAEEEAKRARERAPLSGQEVYQRTLRSTAYVYVRLRSGAQGNGTGSLIDKKRRLVLTAYHVVDNTSEVRIFFPAYDATGKVISDRAFYRGRPSHTARVIARNSGADLAIVQLNSLPDGPLELPLAESSPSPGSRVHTVGNPGASAGLWAYTVGAVKQVARRRFTFVNRQTVDAFVVETQNPINRGDSGGPVVNDRVELVAVNSGGSENIREGNLCIDIREVRALLGTIQ